MLTKAYAKINLSLDVVGKREDGYHLLNMIVQNIELYDEIILNKNSTSINLKCNKDFIPIDNRNLAYKAAKLFIEEYQIKGGVDIIIYKNIPIAAGLAGGSSDAAAVLKCMRKIYKLDISDEELMELGLKIGADVPYCIKGGTALCKGIGEIITPLKPFKGHILVLVKPSFGVSTKEIYSKLDLKGVKKHPNIEELVKAIENNDINFVSNNMRNVLEYVTLNEYKVLKTIKENLMDMGAIGAMMSGSGPTIFGFFDDMLKAQRCFVKMRQEFKEVYITRTV